MNAQVNDIPLIGNRFTFGVDGGIAMPAGNFGSTDNSNGTINGFAKSGFHYDIYAGVRLISCLGIMAQYGANNNSFNTAAINTPPGGSASASGGYTTSEYLVGPYLSFKLIKIKIEVKLLAGEVTNKYPTLSFDSYGNSVSDAFQNGSGFGYCAGAKIKYMVAGGMLGIGLGLNYVGSDMNYSGWSQTSVSGGTTQYGSFKTSVGLIEATLGLSLDI